MSKLVKNCPHIWKHPEQGKNVLTVCAKMKFDVCPLAIKIGCTLTTHSNCGLCLACRNRPVFQCLVVWGSWNRPSPLELWRSGAVRVGVFWWTNSFLKLPVRFSVYAPVIIIIINPLSPSFLFHIYLFI